MNIEKTTQTLLTSVAEVVTVADFEAWIRSEFRRSVPHAAFLATLGRLYGIGSVPTHRLSVDFPLGMVEALKNGVGALDDPLMAGWFRSGKLRCFSMEGFDRTDGHHQWRQTVCSFGFRNAMIHGVLDHKARRFAVFQVFNYLDELSPINVSLFSRLINAVSDAAWATVDRRASASRGLLGHPTLSLTPTELHIIELLAQGLSNKEIARLRGVSDSTVKTQVQRTGAKLGATRRAEIVAIALPMLCPLPPQTLIDYGDR